MSKQTHYQILGITPHASHSRVRSAYRKALCRYHPDTNQGERGGEEMLRRVLTAGHILNNPKRRAAYDETLHPQPRKTATTAPNRVKQLANRLKQLTVTGRRTFQAFFSPEQATRVEERARRVRKKALNFGVCLFVAIRRNRDTSYCKGTDGVYRKNK